MKSWKYEKDDSTGEVFAVYHSVPIFKEHTGSDGTKYTQQLLENIADNNNDRIEETGDYCPIVGWHTPSDNDPSKDPPIIGFAENFRVEKFGKKNPKWCIYATFKIRKDKHDYFRDHPRRSVEIWPEDKPENRYIDPIAVLGAETPRQDLGLVYSKSAAGEESYMYSSVAGGGNTYVPGEVERNDKPGPKDPRRTPAPKKDRVKGSSKNPKGSASKANENIEVSDKTEASLKKKMETHNKSDKGSKATLGALKSVYRRGAGAYSTSHAPNMSRHGWAMARVNAFLKLLRSGKPENSNYTQDNDLLPKGHPKKSKNSKRSEFVRKLQRYAKESTLLSHDDLGAGDFSHGHKWGHRGGAGPRQRYAAPGARAFNEPHAPTADLAKKYIEENKELIGDSHAPRKITKIDPEISKKIAQHYIEGKNDPENPEVMKSYKAMADEALMQMKTLVDAGYKVEMYTGGAEPYRNSQEMIDDLNENQHLWVFPTEDGFGESGITDEDRRVKPMLKDSGYKDINGKPMLVNDVFRAVHDFFGHSELGNSFGPVGEENAWQIHSRMFSPEARKAMTTGTRGQNSWVNFGPHIVREDGSVPKKGDEDYTPPAERPFAEQKLFLMPDDVVNATDDHYGEAMEYSKDQSAKDADRNFLGALAGAARGLGAAAGGAARAAGGAARAGGRAAAGTAKTGTKAVSKAPKAAATAPKSVPKATPKPTAKTATATATTTSPAKKKTSTISEARRRARQAQQVGAGQGQRGRQDQQVSEPAPRTQAPAPAVVTGYSKDDAWSEFREQNPKLTMFVNMREAANEIVDRISAAGGMPITSGEAREMATYEKDKKQEPDKYLGPLAVGPALALAGAAGASQSYAKRKGPRPVRKPRRKSGFNFDKDDKSADVPRLDDVLDGAEEMALDQQDIQQIVEGLRPTIIDIVQQEIASIVAGEDMGPEDSLEEREEVDVVPDEELEDVLEGEPEDEVLMGQDDEPDEEEDEDEDEDEPEKNAKIEYGKELFAKMAEKHRLYEKDADHKGASQYMASMDDSDRNAMESYMKSDKPEQKEKDAYGKCGDYGKDMKDSYSKDSEVAEADKYRKELSSQADKYSKLQQQYSKLQSELVEAKDQLTEVRRSERYHKIADRLANLEAEGYTFDKEKELEFCMQLSDEMREEHLAERIPQQYAKCPVGAPIPVEESEKLQPVEQKSIKYSRAANLATQKLRAQGHKGVSFDKVLKHMCDNDTDECPSVEDLK